MKTRRRSIATCTALRGGAFARLGLLTLLPEPVRPTVKWVHRKIGAFAWGAGVCATLLAGKEGLCGGAGECAYLLR